MTNDISQSSKPQFREATNLLRGICALAILVFHYQHFFYTGTSADNFNIEMQPFYEALSFFYLNGARAVQIFWCISGLILTHTYFAKTGTDAHSFVLSRFSRLYPLHLITLLIVAVLQLTSKTSLNTFQIYESNNKTSFFLNLFYVQKWVPDTGLSFNAPTWSVSVELAVYIMFFMVLKLIQRYKELVPMFILIVLQFVKVNFQTYATNIFFYECLTYFTAGVFLYFFVERLSKRSVRPLLLICEFSLIGGFGMALHYRSKVEPDSPLWLVIGVLLVFFVAQIDDSKLAPFLIRVRMLGDLSYSVFLWHVPIQITIKLVQSKYSIDNSIAYNKTFFIVFIALTYFVGYLSYRYIEQPAQRIIRTRFARTAAI
jgi:peptidoglycan/LPS O-acetylase OafA/YrhL